MRSVSRLDPILPHVVIGTGGAGLQRRIFLATTGGRSGLYLIIQHGSFNLKYLASLGRSQGLGGGQRSHGSVGPGRHELAGAWDLGHVRMADGAGRHANTLPGISGMLAAQLTFGILEQEFGMNSGHGSVCGHPRRLLQQAPPRRQLAPVTLGQRLNGCSPAGVPHGTGAPSGRGHVGH